MLQQVLEPNETMRKVEKFARRILQVGERQVPEISISDDREPNWIKIP